MRCQQRAPGAASPLTFPRGAATSSASQRQPSPLGQGEHQARGHPTASAGPTSPGPTKQGGEALLRLPSARGPAGLRQQLAARAGGGAGALPPAWCHLPRPRHGAALLTPRWALDVPGNGAISPPPRSLERKLKKKKRTVKTAARCPFPFHF